jgi:hypothetical protein
LKPGHPNDDKDWYRRVLDRAKKNGIDLHDGHRVYLNLADTSDVIPDWAKLDLEVAFYTEPRPVHRVYDVFHGFGEDADLALELAPTKVSLSAFVDVSASRIESLTVFAEYTVEQLHAKPNVSNWVDLYGSEMVLQVATPHSAGEGPSISLLLHYRDTISPHRLLVKLEDGEHRTDIRNELFDTAYYSSILTDYNLEQFPEDYKQLFPEKAKQIDLLVDLRRKARAKPGGKPK